MLSESRKQEFSRIFFGKGDPKVYANTVGVIRGIALTE
jgi:hypothetical protein